MKNIKRHNPQQIPTPHAPSPVPGDHYSPPSHQRPPESKPTGWKPKSG